MFNKIEEILKAMRKIQENCEERKNTNNHLIEITNKICAMDFIGYAIKKKWVNTPEGKMFKITFNENDDGKIEVDFADAYAWELYYSNEAEWIDAQVEKDEKLAPIVQTLRSFLQNEIALNV